MRTRLRLTAILGLFLGTAAQTRFTFNEVARTGQAVPGTGGKLVREDYGQTCLSV